MLRGICGECCFVGLSPKLARLRSLRGLLDGRPLSLPYFHNARLERWARTILARPALSRVFVYCSAMASYVPLERRRSSSCLADIVDVDSEKWVEYARDARWPESWLLAREGAKLRAVEREIAESFAATLVATSAERDILKSIAPNAVERIIDVANGVDSAYFSPDRAYERPARMQERSLVFTGAMDYRPNVEAVTYFVHEVLPRIRTRFAGVQFVVVGSNPAPAVRALENQNDVLVTGRVPDVRPYLMHANAVVVPLRIARGIQNKVLEGMAMAKPVVASPQALVGIDAEIGRDILVGDTPAAFAAAVEKAMAPGGEEIGRRARARVIEGYSWAASLARIDAIIDPPSSTGKMAI